MNILENTISELSKGRIKNSDDLALLKRKMAKIYKVPCPDNISLLKTYHEMLENKRMKKSAMIENLLRKRPIRSLSGIVNISVLTKPYPCPGKCLYCPQESGIPKSYVPGEPAVERAKKLNYDPYQQTKKRIEMLNLEGHPTDKIELRIVGGTWSYYPKKYQTWFILRCFQAANANKNTPFNKTYINNYTPVELLIQELEKEQKKNEKAKHRIIGLSIETRPDFINPKEIEQLRRLGVTMVELGVQSIYDDVLRKNLRGHEVKETIKATKLLKDAGFKVLYQMMPNLPGSNLEKDEKMFKELFDKPDFQPDLLKIYPCALLKKAPLYRLWKKGGYRPYSQLQLINLIRAIKKIIPYYVRIQRISRDIPSKAILAGPARISNLRQILTEKMKRENWQCKCIRCREVKGKYNPKENPCLFRQDYPASEGKEIFLSFEDKKRTKLFSLLRLRITSDGKAIIREIHTYGQLMPIKENLSPMLSPQHRGLGKKLMKEAEEIVRKELKLKKIAVISGVGVRPYFRSLGYRLENSYMVKLL